MALLTVRWEQEVEITEATNQDLRESTRRSTRASQPSCVRSESWTNPNASFE